LTLPDQALPYIARWSPDGQSMALVLLSPTGVDLYRYQPSSNILEQLTDSPLCTEVGLAWNGSQVLRYASLCREAGSPTRIYELDLSSRATTELGIIPLQALYVTWNPSLELLALAYPQTLESGERKVSIYVQAGAGLGIDNVTSPVSAVTDAAEGVSGLLSTVMDWSPDGTRLVYVSKMMDGVTYLLSLPGQGGEASVIRAVPGECLFPRWSPAGERLSLVCGTDLFLVTPDGSRQDLLVEAQEGWFISFPAWSLDGQSLAFLAAAVDNPAARRLEVISLQTQSRTALGEALGAWQAGIFWNTPGAATVAAQPTLAVTATGGTGDLQPASVPPLVWWGWGILLLVLGLAVIARRLRRAGFDPLGDLGNWSLFSGLRQWLARSSPASQAEAAPEWQEAPPGSAPSAARPLRSAPPTPDGDPQTLMNGINLVRSGAYEEGILALRQYLAADEHSHVAWLWLGHASAQLGDLRAAQRCFLRAEKLGSASARTSLARLQNRPPGQNRPPN
jgi:hypothetical protein